MSISIAFKRLLGYPTSNEALMERYSADGDIKAFEQLYDNCAKDLYHYIVSQSNTTLAKDVCQKTWLKVIEKHRLYSPDGKFKAWLFVLARNVLMDEYRSQKRIQSLDELNDIPANQTEGTDPSASTCFNTALNALPFEQREAFVLQQEGFSLSEIAMITHVPQETVKSRLRYARRQLKLALEAFYV